MKKIMLVFGTRPEAIKMCPIVKELKQRNHFEVCVCVSGQHKEMLEQVLKIFDVECDYNLSIMKPKQTLYDVTSNVLLAMKQVLEMEVPDIVLVHGDTTTTFSAALACFYSGIKIGHVEAGLRTYNLNAPFPEEFNRQAVGIISKYHFAPTKQAAEYLIKEGKNKEDIYITGNSAIDALTQTLSHKFDHPLLEWAKGYRLIVLTAHRRENLGKPLHHIFKAISRIVNDFSDVKVIYPIHLNPSIKEVAKLYFDQQEKMVLTEPLDVIGFHHLLKASYLILTDSGGIQEEAPALGKPVLVLRDVTERPEGICAGTLKLVGTQENHLYNEIASLLTNQEAYQKMSNAKNPYGDGHTSEYIADILEKVL
ncbi:MAG: UDP-N-acetylglucosamine 2-epimerase (non-hydrolyzing) [Erysipelotrichaceae bacterium]